MDATALNVPEQGIERPAAHLTALFKVKKQVMVLHIGETGEPIGFLNPPQFLALHFGNDIGGGVGEGFSRADTLQRLAHRGG